MRMSRFWPLALFSVLVPVLAGCAPLAPIEPPKQAKQQVQGLQIMSLADLIKTYAPAGFQADPDADVDYSMSVQVDTSLPWQVAFHEALQRAKLSEAMLIASGRSDHLEPIAPVSAPLMSKSVVTTEAPPPTRTVAPVLQSAVDHAPIKIEPATPTEPFVRECERSPTTGLVGADSVWVYSKNDSIKETSLRWAKTARWDVSWNYKDEQTGELSDLAVDAGLKCRGRFEDAITTLYKNLPGSINIHATFGVKNDPPVLYVTNNEEQGR